MKCADSELSNIDHTFWKHRTGNDLREVPRTFFVFGSENYRMASLSKVFHVPLSFHLNHRIVEQVLQPNL